MKVLSIEVAAESIGTDVDVLKVNFDDDTFAYMIYRYSDSLKYIDQEVIVTFREDIYNNQICTFVNTIAVPTHVNLYDKEDDFKLFTDVEDNESNIIFKEMGIGDLRLNAIMYCTAQKYKSSDRSKANWVELTVRDKMWKYTTLRLFDPEFRDSDFTGRYIQCDVTKSEYGLTTSWITPCSSAREVTLDVDLACEFIERILKRDDVKFYIAQYDYLRMCSEYLADSGKGHEAIKLAFELELLKSTKNMLNKVNYDILETALVMSHSFVLSPNSTFTHTFQNMVNTNKSNLEKKISVMHVLDDNPECEDFDSERRVFRTIKNTAKELINERYWGL